MKKRNTNHIVKATSSVLLAGVVTISTPGLMTTVNAAVDAADIKIKDITYAGDGTERISYDAFEVSFEKDTIFEDGNNLLLEAFDNEEITVTVNGEEYEMDEFGQNIDMTKKKVKIEKVPEVKEEEKVSELPAGIDTLAGATGGGGAASGGGLVLIPAFSGIEDSHYEVNSKFFTIGDNYETILLSKAAFTPGENEVVIEISGKKITATIDANMTEEPVIESVESIPMDGETLPKIKITGTAPAGSTIDLAFYKEKFEYLELAPITADKSGKFELLIESADAFAHPEYYKLKIKDGSFKNTTVSNLTAVIAIAKDGDKIKSNEVVEAYKLNLDELKKQIDRAEEFKSEMTEKQEEQRMTAFKNYTDASYMGTGWQYEMDQQAEELKAMLDKIENKEVDTTKLEKALNNEAKIVASEEYKNASEEEKKAYTEAIEAGKKITEKSTQKEIDEAQRAIANAEYNIMEVAPLEIDSLTYNPNTINFVVKFKKAAGYNGTVDMEKLVFKNIDENNAQVYVNGVEYTKALSQKEKQKNTFDFAEDKYLEDIELDETAFVNGENNVEIVLGNMRINKVVNIERTEAPEVELISVPRTPNSKEKIVIKGKTAPNANLNMFFYGSEIGDVVRLRPLTADAEGNFEVEFEGTEIAGIVERGYIIPGLDSAGNEVVHKTNICNLYELCVRATDGDKIVSNEVSKTLLTDVSELAKTVRIFGEFLDKHEDFQISKEEITKYIGAKSNVDRHTYEKTLDQKMIDDLNRELFNIMILSGLEIPEDPGTEVVEPEKPVNPVEPEKPVDPEKPVKPEKPNKPSRGGGGGGGGTSSPVVRSERIAGNNRMNTAVEVSKSMYKNGTKTVILANKAKFADVLTAAPLAAQKKAPILFVNENSIPKETMDEIKRLGATNIFINGGESSVSKEVEKQLEGKKIERFAGKDRYETASLIAEKIRENGSKSIVEVANGEIFADALSMSSLAVKENAPIILVKKNSVSNETKKTLLTWKKDIKKVNIAGGTNSVSDLAEKIAATQSNVKLKRYAGTDRYETAVKIAEAVKKNSTNVVYTSGEQFADALVAGPLAAKKEAPVLLVEKNNLPSEVKEYTRHSGVRNIFVIGGENTITNTVVTEIKNAAK